MWDPDDFGFKHPPSPRENKGPIIESLDDLNDGRCKVSSYGEPIKTKEPRYEHYFGTGGFNRCIGPDGHNNPTHKDEFGNIFTIVDVFGVRRYHQIATEKP